MTVVAPKGQKKAKVHRFQACDLSLVYMVNGVHIWSKCSTPFLLALFSNLEWLRLYLADSKSCQLMD